MLHGKIALITGAGGGIGLALARRFAAAGASLALWDVVVSETITRELEQRNVPCLFDKVDITRKEEVESGVKRILERFSRIDILVNNAGITRDKLLLRMDEDDWDAVINVNLKAAFLCSKIVGRVMFSQQSGRIVNMASIIGQIGNIGQANYAASKGGLIALTKTCAREFARNGVAVNAIAPGYIRTRMTDAIPDKIKERMLAQVPLSRLGTPEDVAEAALFLASDAAGYITGQVIRVDGGLVM